MKSRIGAGQERRQRQGLSDERSSRTLRGPVVDEAYLLGEAERDEVGYPEGREDDGQEGEGGRLGLEAARVRLLPVSTRDRRRACEGLATHHSHGLSDDIDQSLVGDGERVRQEEETQRDVEERQRRQDRLGRYERHFGSRRGRASERRP